MKILFPNFLENPKVYQKAENFWKKIIDKIAQKKEMSLQWQWQNTFLPDGQKMYDGNPIVTAYFVGTTKSIRIIQENYSDSLYKINACLHKTEYENSELFELVIAVELVENASKSIQNLIEKYLETDDLDEIEKFIRTEIEYFRLLSSKKYPDWKKEIQTYMPFSFLKNTLSVQTPKDYLKYSIEIFGECDIKKIQKKSFKKYYARGNNKNQHKIFCWLKTASLLAKNQILDDFDFKNEHEILQKIKKNLFSGNLLEDIKNILNEFGIKIIFLPYIKSTKIDAAIFWENKNPIIVFAKRYCQTRLDYFVFTLFHELGHLFKHIKKVQNKYFFDEFDSNLENKLEEEANIFAQNSLIPKKEWQFFLEKANFSEEAIHTFSKKIELPVYLLAGRLIFEKKIPSFVFPTFEW